jgi:predicted hydrocarbon binding protein
MRGVVGDAEAVGEAPTYRYRLDDVYPDQELGMLALKAAEVTATPPLELLEAFGEALAPDMMRLYAYLIEPAWRYADFLLNMERVLNEALKLHTPGALQAKISAERLGAERVRVTYDSQLRACPAVQGVIVGAAHEYGVKVEVTQEQCVLRGAPHCVFDIQYRSGEAP